MPDLPDPPSITDTLRTLIAEELQANRRNLKQIAADAEVPYQVLQKWSRGDVAKLDVGIAERVYQTLTGKVFGHVE
jgi:hypothetical protein